ncbi:hypothetical protein [Paraburkholderia tropica]|uniref:hypothetical protein n=1 Tax=Paraburkholderia tropica TaxID=92647 RepID=UPI002ABD6B4C|nr:hypothetical protein [Paraburkholderia tropica]
MSTSENFWNGPKHLGVQTLWVDNGPEIRGDAVGNFVRHIPALAPRPNGVVLAPPSSSRVLLSMRENANHRGLPPPTLPVTSANHAPKSIRFIDGPDIALRRTILRRRMHEASVDGAYQLFVASEKGQVSVRLFRAVVSASAQSAGNACAVVGIDGVDQFLASPGKIACHIKALANVAANVICSIDSRCCDWLLLVFHLRVLGLKVVHEKLAASVYLDRSFMKRYVECEMALRSFPVTSTRKQATFAYRIRRMDGYIEIVPGYVLKAPLRMKTSSLQVAARNVAWQAAAHRDADNCACAIRNHFAFRQLVIERRRGA